MKISKERLVVLEKLRQISHEEIKALLNAKQNVDPTVGIIIAKLDKPPVLGELNQEYNFYAARVLLPSPDNPNFVNPHYHNKGTEPYRFLFGTGEMNKGIVKDGEVVWDEPKNVGPNNEVGIDGGIVHSFRNTGREPADFVFACPKSHLINNDSEHPEGDRYFTKSLKNGVPPWYK